MKNVIVKTQALKKILPNRESDRKSIRWCEF